MIQKKDNPTLGQGYEEYWGLQTEPSAMDLQKIAQFQDDLAAQKEAMLQKEQGLILGQTSDALSPEEQARIKALMLQRLMSK